MAKCEADFKTVDMFDGKVGKRVRSVVAQVRRRDVQSLSVKVRAELCAWCGVDRVGSCGACSDLRSHQR